MHWQGSRLCLMCPDNMTNLEDGSEGCGAPIQPGTNLTMRFAVIVSFGVYLNGASLDEIATKVSIRETNPPPSPPLLGGVLRSPQSFSSYSVLWKSLHVWKPHSLCDMEVPPCTMEASLPL